MRRPRNARYARRLFGSITRRCILGNLCDGNVTCFHRLICGYAQLIAILASVLLIASASLAQDLEWARQAGGAASEVGRGIAVDSSGNSYATGTFHGSATFGAGELNETTLVDAGSGDIFIAKYDTAGMIAWARRAGGTTGDTGWGIAVDSSGNSYVTGTFFGSATFGAGELNQTTLVTAGSIDIFVAKYDTDGMLLWAKRAGGTSLGEEGLGIVVDGAGNSYVTGTFEGSATFGAGELNQTTLVTAGSIDIFVAKYDTDGMLVWARQAGGTSNDVGFAIAVDSAGNGYVTGSFEASATFGAGELNETTLVTAGSLPGSVSDMFIAKYDGGGLLAWAKRPAEQVPTRKVLASPWTLPGIAT